MAFTLALLALFTSYGLQAFGGLIIPSRKGTDDIPRMVACACDLWSPRSPAVSWLDFYVGGVVYRDENGAIN